MENTQLRTYTLEEAKTKYIGEIGTEKRDKYEYELRLDLLGEMIKQARQERKTAAQYTGHERQSHAGTLPAGAIPHS